jgi:23S rRNA pseudouridine2604 synthase
MVTLTLKKKPVSPHEQGKPAGRAPLRGHGARPRPTLAEAQAQREQEQLAWEREQARLHEPRRPLSVQNPRFAQQLAERQAPRRDTAAPQQPPTPRRPDRPDRNAPARPLKSVVNPQVARQMGVARPTAPPPVAAPSPSHVASAEGERLSKRMTALGLASRRESDAWIEAGWVRVNGRLAVLGQRVRPDDKITVDPAAHREQAQRVTILLNKPIGYVSGQAEDGYEPAAVLLRPENQWKEDQSGLRWHPGHLRGLAPAGRLDIDSLGLLVLTQDGRVARQLIGDDSHIEKEYLVRVEYLHGPRLPDADLALLNHGLTLDDHVLRPCKVSWQNEDQLRFVLREGRKRQIRRMCEAVGLKVLGLKRVRIGSVNLGHLPAGQWRYLRRDEFFA